jgi:hypothetical protein
MMDWTVTVKIGGTGTGTWPHEFTITGPTSDEVSDTPAVLDGLRFGWRLPQNGIYPDQPEAMSAEWSLNVPAFADYADIARGDEVAIELEAAGYDYAAFYGRITDAKARPRDQGDESAGGVIIDCAAIDYTADPVEEYVTPPGPAVLPAPIYEYDTLQRAFFNAFGAVLPGDADGLPDYWTSRADINVPEEFYLNAKPAEQIAVILRQAVSWTTRMILSPRIGSNGHLNDVRAFTIDTIVTHPSTDPDWTVDASAVSMDVTWKQVKGEAPDRVVATFDYPDGAGGTTTREVVATRAGAAWPYIDVPMTLQLAIPFSADWRALEVGQSYLANDTTDQGWQVETVQVQVDQLPGGVDTIALFPRWKDDEGDPFGFGYYTRSMCYNLNVTVENIDPSVHPTGGTTMSGGLAGAQVTMVDGIPVIDLALHSVTY